MSFFTQQFAEKTTLICVPNYWNKLWLDNFVDDAKKELLVDIKSLENVDFIWELSFVVTSVPMHGCREIGSFDILFEVRVVQT